jgi:Pyruvate/2-oxoacid:ferredoxin oxidoreductase gamma subunit
MGDGDALSIGGNHFIHAARRNIAITAIVMNNRIYGMTGGQYSPLTGPGMLATTAPYSNIDQGFDVVEMAKAAGATFVARTTTYHVQQMADIIRQAILHDGFSVVEVMTQCPTYFGRKNKQGSAVDMMKRMKEMTTTHRIEEKVENPELIERGIFVQTEKPEYCSEYNKIIERAMGERIMERCRMVFSGSGGQGVITAAIILAESAVLHENLTAVQTQAYGAAARGGATRSDVIISDTSDQLSQGDPAQRAGLPDPGGLQQVFRHHPSGRAVDYRYAVRQDPTQGGCPTAGTAHVSTVMDKIGKPIVFNICMLGAVVGLTGLSAPNPS